MADMLSSYVRLVMDIESIKSLISLIGSFGIGAVLGGFIIGFFLKSFVPSYLSEKGKNLATKEDIASITDKVESVKTEYAKVIEELRASNKLKISEIEREKIIKKEVYLESVESITKAQNFFVNLSNLNFPTEELSRRMNDEAGVIAKVQIVGSERTVKAVTTVMAAIGTAVLELMLERVSLEERKSEIERLSVLRSTNEDEVDRYVKIMKDLNLEGNHDQRLWDTINGGVLFESEQRDKLTDEIDKLWEVQKRDHLDFSKKCMERFFEVTSLMAEVVLAVRAELNLPISDAAYLDIFNGSIEEGKRVFDSFISKVSNIHV